MIRPHLPIAESCQPDDWPLTSWGPKTWKPWASFMSGERDIATSRPRWNRRCSDTT